ncbi:transmembrane protein 161-like emei [Dermacentor variabilis]|uniref:transmembrane protein 161-like emei n=1 Tax=Dermacentor variabilis TaxID=34621 RepID=UPI003F5BF97B
MALFGVQIVITMIMASVLQKLSPQYSISRWIICKRLIRYLHPSDEELKSLAGISGKSFKGKNKREKWRNRNGSLDDGKDYEEFLVPKSIPVVLQAAPITANEALQLRFYTDYQWLMDFAVHAVLVYSITEAYRYYFADREEINLSLVWCLLVLGFAVKVLFSLTALYFRGEEPIGERSLCLVSGFTFFVLAMVALIADEEFLEFGLRDAYRSFNESSHQFLQTQGLSSSGPTSQLMFKFFLAVWCGLVGAFFTFPGLRYARMHWDAFKYCEGQHFIRLLLHLSFVSPLFVVLLWVKPLAREYFTERSFPGMRGNLMSSQAFEATRIVLVLAVVVLRLCLMPRYLQSYLNLAPEKMAELRKEAGNISNIDLQRKVVRVFYYLCVVALQYITPLLTCAFTALLLKTLGGHSWIAYLWSPDSPGAPLHHNTVPGVPSRGPSPESILATSQQFSLTLAGLRAVFTPVLFRGVLSFMTWWLCATSFATSVVGLVYHSYTS